jgi:hypothetical protein
MMGLVEGHAEFDPGKKTKGVHDQPDVPGQDNEQIDEDADSRAEFTEELVLRQPT